MALEFFPEPPGDAVLQWAEELLDVGERGRGVVVIDLQAVLVVLPVRGDLIDHEPCLLDRRAAVFEFATDFISGLFQRTIQAEGLCIRRADPRTGAVPPRWGVGFPAHAAQSAHRPWSRAAWHRGCHRPQRLDPQAIAPAPGQHRSEGLRESERKSSPSWHSLFPSDVPTFDIVSLSLELTSLKSRLSPSLGP